MQDYSSFAAFLLKSRSNAANLPLQKAAQAVPPCAAQSGEAGLPA
ncbi:hypothetical protein [Acinetobacter sp. WCHAc010034]|nr:hypothetical protein [Acinetobacter sp. WCHAc010034]